jgi:hypothetical protein
MQGFYVVGPYACTCCSSVRVVVCHACILPLVCVTCLFACGCPLCVCRLHASLCVSLVCLLVCVPFECVACMLPCLLLCGDLHLRNVPFAEGHLVLPAAKTAADAPVPVPVGDRTTHRASPATSEATTVGALDAKKRHRAAGKHVQPSGKKMNQRDAAQKLHEHFQA